MIRDTYQIADFDFALVYLENLDLFYVFPVDVLISYGSEIHLVEAEKRQCKPRSTVYRDAWYLISRGAANLQPSLDSMNPFVPPVSENKDSVSVH